MNKPPDERLDELERRFHEGDAPPPEDEREQLRGTLLARRLARRRGYGVAMPEPRRRRLFSTFALLAIAALAAWSFSGVLPELRYWSSRAAPQDLGHLHAYRADVPDGSYVKVEGIASPKRGSYQRFWRTHEVFPLIGSRILIDRAEPPDPSLQSYGFRYAGEGRLVRAAQGSRWDAARAVFAERGELPAEGQLFVVIDGDAPGRGWRVPAEAAFWVLLAAGALAVAARRTIRKLRAAAD